ncbi:MAG: ABC transporter ATP-binding protein [Candidatus Rokubacteria bacterium]|nr:ABC transporter ATP-binding protein [Candidatus Rokubacteria bacterium]
MLDLREVTAGYGDEPVVVGFSHRVPAAAITTLVGPNGAGKSTLLRAIYGLVVQVGGRIVFEDEELGDLPPAARLRRGIGFVPQGRCNFPLMTVCENLQLGTYTLARAEATRAVERVLALFPVLRARWRVLAGNLSGGEQQLLEMAMVLETAPRLLLLDEPSLGLSPANLDQVFDTIADIRRRGVTVVMVEQNVEAALAISDTAVVMDLGRKVLEGPAHAVMEDPRVRAVYLGGTAAGESR